MILRRFSNVISKLKKIEIGDQVTVARQIKREDLETFMSVSGDTNPIHSTQSQEAVVHGAFLNSIVSSVIGTKLPGSGTIVVQQTLNFPNKCYVGETVNTTVKILECRKIIKVEFTCETDDNKIVLYGTAKLIMNKC